MTGQPRQRLARRFWAARQRERLKDRRIAELEDKVELLESALNQPPLPHPIGGVPLEPPSLQPAPNGRVMGALIVPEPCPHCEIGTLTHAARHNGYHKYTCSRCPHITTKPTGERA